jgi:hypothetical protein
VNLFSRTILPGFEQVCAKSLDVSFSTRSKSLRGAKPHEIPIEQPTKFNLVVNLKTAKAMGLSIPESFLALANEVI